MSQQGQELDKLKGKLEESINKEQEELNNYFSKLITQLNYTWLMRLIHKSTYLVKTPAATKIGYQN